MSLLSRIALFGAAVSFVVAVMVSPVWAAEGGKAGVRQQEPAKVEQHVVPQGQRAPVNSVRTVDRRGAARGERLVPERHFNRHYSDHTYYNGYRRSDGYYWCNGVWVPLLGPIGCF